MKSKQLRVAVVIAAYNEGEVLADVITRVPETLEGLGKTEVIVVDDGSRDTTSAVAAAVGATVVRHPINRGQGAALKTGFEYALQHGFDVVVTYDADGQHRADEIASLVRALVDNDVDIVLGSRFLGKAINMSSSRKTVLKIGVLFTRILSRVPVTDTHNGFRAIRVSALERMRLVQDRMEHASEIIDQIHQQNLKFIEVPVTIEYTDYSRGKGQANSAALRIAGKMIAYKFMK